MPTTTTQMLTLAEVATQLNIEYRTAQRLAVSGQLPAIRVGRVWRIDPDRLAAFRRGETSQDAP